MNRPRIQNFVDNQEYLIQLNQYVNYLEETVQSERKQVLAMSEYIKRHCNLVETLIKNTQDVTDRLVKNENQDIQNLHFPVQGGGWPDKNAKTYTMKVEHEPTVSMVTIAAVLFVFLVLSAIIVGTWKI